MSPLREQLKFTPSTSGIKKGDQVRVMTGKDRGKTGRVLTVNPAKRTVTVEHAGMIKRHTRPNPSQEREGRHCRERGFHIPLERASALRGLQQGHARGTQYFTGRHQGANLPPLRQYA